MAGSLIDSMAGDFDPEDFKDNYREALQEVIDAKVEGREVVQPEEVEEAPAAAVDLMAALKASVDRARAARGEEGGEPTPISSARSAKKAEPAKKAPAKKAEPAKKAAAKKAEPAKKAAAKKTTAKKAPAKKTAARKSA
jgi:DNA end-binding protein Ku